MWPDRPSLSSAAQPPPVRAGRRALGVALSALVALPVTAVVTPTSFAATPAVRPAATAAATPAAPAPALPVISRGVPAHASSDRWEPAGRANDSDYGTSWRSLGTPAWLAYDLSSVPLERRGRVLASWSNTSYGYSTRYGPHYNNLGSYTIEVNHAPGGGAAPASGWVTRVAVHGNTLHSRQHVLDLAGATWVRLSVTASDGSPLNTDASVNAFDLHALGSATGPVPDSFVFYGDSITAGSMCPCPQEGTAALPALVNAAQPGRWPVVENGGDPFETSGGAVTALLGSTGSNGYLSLFPGAYVGLSYGMNDAASSTGQDAYHANMRKLVQAVLAAGKTPMIPTISYTDDAARNAVIPSYNAVIARLYAEFPQVLRGPDLWSFFSARPELVADGDIHPTPAGYAALRTQWAKTLLSTVYGSAGTTPAPSPGATPAPSPGATPPPAPAPAPAAGTMTGLRASGNRILNSAGQPVRLIGVNHSGTEYACVGGAGHTSTGYGVHEPADFDTNGAYYDAIRSWGSNTLRLGLNEACWLGINGVAPAFSGANYRAGIRRAVELATARGLAVVLELHWSAPGHHVPHGQSPMPNRDHTPAFWTSVAQTFQSSTNVVFDLFNEPYPHGNQDTTDAWQCWRDGSDPTDPGNTRRCQGTEYWDTDGNASSGGKPLPYAVAGMQELLTAVRSTGARNLVLLSGIQYANNLRGWLPHRPVDPIGNLAASWHVYPFNTCHSRPCWDTQIAPVATTVPLIAAEIGDHDCATTFAPPVMSWLDTHHAGYLAWTWNTWGCSGLQLITDYTTGTPTPYGKPIHDHIRRVMRERGPRERP